MYRKSLGMDGLTYDSAAESKIANWLLLHDVEYVAHKRLPKPSRQICDFYLPDFDLWIEYDGLMAVRSDDKLVRKEAFYQEHGLRYLIINRDNWETELYIAILGA